MLKQLIPAVAFFAFVGTAAQAQTVIYDNTENVINYFSNDGATSRNLNTYLVADDINPIDGTAGAQITEFTFFVINPGLNDVIADAHVSFYDDSGPDTFDAGPGTYIGGVDFDSYTFQAQSYTALSYIVPADQSIFTVPDDQSFWAGVSFSANPGTSADDLNQLGQFISDPATVGGSDDKFFYSDLQGSNTFDDPPGYAGYTFGGGTPASFAWEFEVAPEPSQYAALGLGILGLGGLALRARRRRAA